MALSNNLFDGMSQEQIMAEIQKTLDRNMRQFVGSKMNGSELAGRMERDLWNTLVPIDRKAEVSCRQMKWKDLESNWWRRQLLKLGNRMFKVRELKQHQIRWYHLLFGFKIESKPTVRLTHEDIEYVCHQSQNTYYHHNTRPLNEELQRRLEEQIELNIRATLANPHGQILADVMYQPSTPAHQISLKLKVTS